MRSLTAALLYPGWPCSSGLELLRRTRDRCALRQIGADGSAGRACLQPQCALHPRRPRVPHALRPAVSPFAGVWIEGVRFVVTDREAFPSSRLGLEIAAALRKLYPPRIDLAQHQG